MWMKEWVTPFTKDLIQLVQAPKILRATQNTPKGHPFTPIVSCRGVVMYRVAKELKSSGH